MFGVRGQLIMKIWVNIDFKSFLYMFKADEIEVTITIFWSTIVSYSLSLLWLLFFYCMLPRMVNVTVSSHYMHKHNPAECRLLPSCLSKAEKHNLTYHIHYKYVEQGIHGFLAVCHLLITNICSIYTSPNTSQTQISLHTAHTLTPFFTYSNTAHTCTTDSQPFSSFGDNLGAAGSVDVEPGKGNLKKSSISSAFSSTSATTTSIHAKVPCLGFLHPLSGEGEARYDLLREIFAEPTTDDHMGNTDDVADAGVDLGGDYINPIVVGDSDASRTSFHNQGVHIPTLSPIRSWGRRCPS